MSTRKVQTFATKNTDDVEVGDDGKIPKTYLPAMPTQADSVAADITTLKNDFNALLAKLRTAGYLSP